MSGFAEELYDRISSRKAKPEDSAPYAGGNGRIDRAVDLFLNDPTFVVWRAGRESPMALMDVGGATGNLGYALRDHFEERIVVDISDVCEGPAEAKGNDFYRSDVDSNGLGYGPDESIDLICALDFIEHIVDPENFAHECHRVLKPGGMVLINTPNIQHWRHLESLVCHGKFPHTSGDEEVYHGGHVAFYNFRDLCLIFDGFTDFKMHLRGLTPDTPPPIWLQLMRHEPPMPPPSVQLSVADLIFSCRKP